MKKLVSSVWFQCCLPEVWSLNSPKICFNRLRYLAKVSIKLQKLHLFKQFKDHTQEGNMETRKMTLFFHLYFPLCLFGIWKYSKIIFRCSPLWSILFCEIPKFLAKSYRFRQLIILFEKVDILRLQKTYLMFCPLAGAKYLFY